MGRRVDSAAGQPGKGGISTLAPLQSPHCLLRRGIPNAAAHFLHNFL